MLKTNGNKLRQLYTFNKTFKIARLLKCSAFADSPFNGLMAHVIKNDLYTSMRV